MPESGVSQPVRGFLAEHIGSTAALDLLLLLRTDPARAWSAHEVAGELRMPVPWAAGQLVALRVSGLLDVEAGEGGAEPLYRYASAGSLARVVDQVAEAYRQRKTRVVALIYAEDRSDALSFADAFRLRRRD